MCSIRRTVAQRCWILSTTKSISSSSTPLDEKNLFNELKKKKRRTDRDRRNFVVLNIRLDRRLLACKHNFLHLKFSAIPKVDDKKLKKNKNWRKSQFTARFFRGDEGLDGLLGWIHRQTSNSSPWITWVSARTRDSLSLICFCARCQSSRIFFLNANQKLKMLETWRNVVAFFPSPIGHRNEHITNVTNR